MELRIPLRGRLVFLGWGIALGAAAVWLTHGRGLLWAAAGWAAAAALPAWLFWGAGRFTAVLQPDGSLTVHSGLLWRQTRWAAAGAALFTVEGAGPLLALVGCRVAAVVTPGGVLVLPGLSRQDAALLHRLTGGGRP